MGLNFFSRNESDPSHFTSLIRASAMATAAEHRPPAAHSTLWHANLAKYPEATVRAWLAEAQAWIQCYVADYRIRALALPYGGYPSDVSWLLRGSAKGTTCRDRLRGELPRRLRIVDR